MFYLKEFNQVTYLSDIPTSLLRAVDIFNPFNCISVKFTIVVLTWHDFKLYAIILPMSFYTHIFRPGNTCFRCKIFPLLTMQNIRDAYILMLLYYIPHYLGSYVMGFETFLNLFLIRYHFYYILFFFFLTGIHILKACTY